jgi:hypothetical protein
MSILTVADLITELQKMPQDLMPLITNGDLPNAEIGSVATAPADFGLLVLLSRVE